MMECVEVKLPWEEEYWTVTHVLEEWSWNKVITEEMGNGEIGRKMYEESKEKNCQRLNTKELKMEKRRHQCVWKDSESL